ncbi:MAG: endonuclease III [Bacteroidetes bacterium]|nr:endonuclease III [Bacteroidota bacterium]MCH7772105.1 endonuclease III [Bacteroidota bacterium]
MQRIIQEIDSLLIEYFGVPMRNKKKPNSVDMLIGTILSQNTNDKNSYRAYKNLKEKFKTWEEVTEQTQSKIERIIKVAGLAKQKSKAITSILKELKKRNKKINLNFLNKLCDEEIISELIKFIGVGVKTASCVLLFSMNRNICPVDTHVHRTLNRIGLVNTNSPEKTFYKINGNIPNGAAHSFHTNLIRLGREICKPSKPKCTICPLIKKCRYKFKNFELHAVHKKNDFMLLDNIS